MRRLSVPTVLWMGGLLIATLGGCSAEEVPGIGPPTGDAGLGGGLDAAGGTGGGGPLDAAVFDFGPAGPESPDPALVDVVQPFVGRPSLYGRNLESGATVAIAADLPVIAGSLMRLLPVITYARKVTLGDVDPTKEIVFGEGFYRAGPTLNESRFGESFTLQRLAFLTLVAADRSAEEMLLDAIGGEDAVNIALGDLPVDGFGRYLGPCAADRAYGRRLDRRFGDAGCVALARWRASGDLASLVPVPFPEAPELDDAAVERAWRAVLEAGEGTATARAWGTLLAMIDARALFDGDTSDRVRDLLDRGLGAGGGADHLPVTAWAGSMESGIYRGRHWVGLVRDGDRSAVLVLLTTDHRESTDVGGFFREAGRGMYEQVVGPVSFDGPPTAEEAPEWLVDVVLLEASEGRHCDRDAGNSFDALVACRRGEGRQRFTIHEQSAATLLLLEGPQVDAAWFWTEPNGTRHRFQVRLDAGGWWAWTRSLRLHVAGEWRLDVFLNGHPYRVAPFTVDP